MTIPNYITEIGEYAFSGCTGLTSLYCNAEVPPTCGDEIFKDVNKSKCILYVPENSISAYQAADQWKEFRKICSTTK